ncbi:MAG: right-handed parallel beta-helix repeat-containing protein [Planctomycetes bacterium]|nr:right-handed parallel beta-helix repeat-containing protein [Planctomycetota bacterium]
MRSGHVTFGSTMLLMAAALLPMVATGGVFAAEGKTYYVSPQGSDENSGLSAGKAFATIAKAATLAAAGDTVNILPGTYVGRIRPAHGGTAEAPITYRRQGEGEVVITTSKETDGGKWEERFAWKLGAGNDYTIIDGMTFRDAEGWVYIGDYAHHNTVRNCTFERCRMYHGIYVNNGSYNAIAGCKFLDAIAYPEGWTPDDPEPALADYISLWRDSHYNLVEGNEFHEITHVAVSIMGHDPDCIASHNIIRGNTFHEPKWKCVSFHAAAHTLVEDNTMTGLAASFIQFHAEKTIVRRNIFTHCRAVRSKPHPTYFHGVLWLKSSVDEYGSMDLAQHSRIYNNTFVDCQVPLTYRGVAGTLLPVSDNVFKNNLFSGFTTPLRLPMPFYKNFTTQQANLFTGNLLFGGPEDGKVFELIPDGKEPGQLMTLAEVVAESPKMCRRQLFDGNLEADPKLTAPDKGDFRPAPGSPCIDGGAALTRTRFAGQGTQVVVEDALYFCDGFRRIDGDLVRIGGNDAVRVTAVDYDMRTLTVDRELTWAAGDAVNLAYQGKAPDIGAVETGAK